MNKKNYSKLMMKEILMKYKLSKMKILEILKKKKENITFMKQNYFGTKRIINKILIKLWVLFIALNMSKNFYKK
jgi:hypothetical protein